MTDEKELERLLGRYAWSGDVPELPDREDGGPEPHVELSAPPAPAHRGPLLRPMAVAALVLGAVSIGVLWYLGELADRALDSLESEGSYAVASLDGKDTRRVRRGQSIATAVGERVEVEVGDIGRLTLEPLSRLTVVEPSGEGAEHQLRLEVGVARASIVAQPRVFQLETPAGVAVDLGCVYRTEVDPDGGARVAVESGLVAFERAGRRVLVPAGAQLAVAAGAGFVLPTWTDSGPELTHASVALAAEDIGPADLAAGLAALEAAGPKRGSLACYHLLDHPQAAVRGAAWDLLVRMVEPPAAATRERTLAGEASARRQWERRLPWAR